VGGGSRDSLLPSWPKIQREAQGRFFYSFYWKRENRANSSYITLGRLRLGKVMTFY
jgi:hypothetical protein